MDHGFGVAFCCHMRHNFLMEVTVMTKRNEIERLRASVCTKVAEHLETLVERETEDEKELQAA